MTYKQFEDLPVWRVALEFAVNIFKLLEDPALTGQGDIKNQLQRSSLSISNNIAEGFERGTTAELLMFIYIARGSAGESRSLLRFMDRMERCAHLQTQIQGQISESENIAKQLRGWADSLQNSPIKGQRHLTDAVREQEDRDRRAAAFAEKLKRITRGEKVTE